MVDLEFGAEFFKFFVVELLSIIGNKSPRQTESTYDVLPDEVSGFVLSYLGRGLGTMIKGQAYQILRFSKSYKIRPNYSPFDPQNLETLEQDFMNSKGLR